MAPSFSIIGSEGVELTAGGMSCVAIPKNREQKRCSFDVRLTNRFREVDLMTPTTFPKPPEGIEGVLMFPLTATATGGTGPVVPSPDWDSGPINFFNDFGACSAGTKTDCVRYETIASPFYGGSTSGLRRIGFDVPVAAEQVTAYIVVAANLRENPVRTSVVRDVDDLCGEVTSESVVVTGGVRMFLGRETAERVIRGFCSFENPLAAVFQSYRIHGATIMVRHVFGLGDPGVEYLPFGETLNPEDYGLPAIHEWHEFPSNDNYRANVTAEVRAAFEAGESLFQFRLRAKHEDDTSIIVEGPHPGNEHQPVLELSYSLR